jgi:putative phage-type endonuclease
MTAGDVQGFVELLPPLSTRTEAWYETRRAGIGGSEIAAVMGISPYLSGFNLWHVKAGNIGSDLSDNPQMEWGRRLEDMILERWFEDHPELFMGRFGLCCRADRPWQMATPDALAADTGSHGDPVAVVEAKTTDSWDGWGEPGTTDVPLWYRAQALWNLDVFGVDVCYMPVLSRGKDYREYVIVRDRAARGDLTFMRKAAKRFLRTVRLGQAPPIDEHDSTREALWLLNPRVADHNVRVPDELAGTLRALRDEADRVKVDLDGVTNEILALVGDGRRAVDGDGKTVLTRSVFERRDIDVKALRLQHPRIARRFERVSDVRQVRMPPRRKGAT